MSNDLAMVLVCVPAGEANAATPKTIWETLGMWSRGWVWHRLQTLLAEGKVHRKQHPIPSGFVWLYWRPE